MSAVEDSRKIEALGQEQIKVIDSRIDMAKRLK
jgi:hypothetical protein